MSKTALMKKVGIIAIVAALAVSVVALAGCQQQPAKKTYSEDEFVTVRVGNWGGTCETPLYVAYEQGFFEEHGIHADVQKITSGSAAFLAEGGYCIFEATPNFIPMMVNGLDIKFISAAHTGCLQAVGGPKSNIQSIADLEGKKVGLFSAAGDPGEVFLKAAMTDAGLDYNKTEWIVEGNIGTILKDLNDGKIDAFAYFDPYPEIAAEYFGCNVFFSISTDEPYKDMTCCFFAANKDVYEDADVSARIATALQEACEWIEKDKAATAELIQDKGYVAESAALVANFGVDTSAGDIADIHEKLLNDYTFGDNGKDAFDKSIQDQIGIIEKAGMMPEGQTAESIAELISAYAL